MQTVKRIHFDTTSLERILICKKPRVHFHFEGILILTTQHIENLFLNPKKISQFAVGFSILAHVLVIGVVKIIKFGSSQAPAEFIQNYVDLGYEQFDEVPQIVDTKEPVIKDITDVPDKSEPNPVAHEMQDQASDVAGLQKDKTEPVKQVSASKNTSQVPYYKIKPKYPKDALVSGVEGFIMLELDIKEDGSVDNVHVTGGDKISVFEMEARRAVVKWKYKPFVNEIGNPIKKEKYLVRVDFRLAEEQSNN